MNANVECMISWGLRGMNQTKYTELWAKQNAELSTASPINYTLCYTQAFIIVNY